MKHALNSLFTLITFICVVFATSVSSIPIVKGIKGKTRGPPPLTHSILSQPTFSDQSSHVRIGDGSGPTIALGDFTGDGYTDLVVGNNLERLRSLRILIWDHSIFAFRNSDQSQDILKQDFSLDDISNFPAEAFITSAVPVDINADGWLDLVISIQISQQLHHGVLLLGDGSGNLFYKDILPGIPPSFLILDANDDTFADIFFISVHHERVFYINQPPGNFSRHVWKPHRAGNDHCIPLSNQNSIAYVDLDGDCASDLIIPTSCGLEVWLNHEPKRIIARWINGQEYRKPKTDFLHLTLHDNSDRLLMLNSSVWLSQAGDNRAVFADFNGDGTIDIGVPNSIDETFRISYNVRKQQLRGSLCTVDPSWAFSTKVVLKDFSVSKTAFGSTAIEESVRIGDFNYDGKLDLLIIDGVSGRVNLFVAHSENDRLPWLTSSSGIMKVVDKILFPMTGGNHKPEEKSVDMLRYNHVDENAIFREIDDPIAATFIDIDESGRQDVLVSQRHGSRLIWNNYKNLHDAVYFKASVMTAALRENTWFKNSSQIRSLVPGNVVKIAYGGRYRRETQACMQCAQGGTLTLQSCSCFFGISRIANYIDEMAIGWGGGVRTWNGLMPNALALIWQQQYNTRKTVKWKISYTPRDRDGQMKRIVSVLCVTLVMLLIVIVYFDVVEKREQRIHKLHV